MPHEHLAVSAFVVVHGALNSVFVSLLILIELSMYSRIANVAELSPFRLQQSGVRYIPHDPGQAGRRFPPPTRLRAVLGRGATADLVKRCSSVGDATQRLVA